MYHLKNKKLLITNTWDNKWNKTYVDYFSTNNDVKLLVTTSPGELIKQAQWADIIWSQWGAIHLSLLSHHINNKLIISHLRSYEILTPELKDVNWANVHGLIFVADHIKLLANLYWKDQLSKVSQITIHDTINISDYPFVDKKPGKNICFVGRIEHKKGIPLLVQCIKAAVQKDSSYIFNIAGIFSEKNFEIYLKHILKELNILKNVKFHDWIEDIPDFLRGMNYLISTSPWEGCPNNVMEAMACGIKPLVHNWRGAREVFPSELVFDTVDDFIKLLDFPEYNSKFYREYAKNKFDSITQMPKMDEYIFNQFNLVNKSTHSFTSIKPSISDNTDLFHTSPQIRLRAMLEKGKELIKSQQLESAEVFLWRAALLTKYQNMDIINLLVQLYKEGDKIPEIKSILKRSAFSALESGDFNTFLELSYTCIYAENLFATAPNYRYCAIDEDINTLIRLHARNHKLNTVVTKAITRLPKLINGKINIGFVLEGFGKNQAPILAYLPFIKYYDSSKFNLHFYSRWNRYGDLARSQDHEFLINKIESAGGHVHVPQKELSPVNQIEFLIDNILSNQIHVLVYQVTHFVPVYNFLSCLRPALFQVEVEHQQPEFSYNMDLIFTTKKQFLECAGTAALFPICFTREDKTEGEVNDIPNIPKGSIILISANRNNRYSQPQFWEELEIVLSKKPNVYFIALGLNNLPDTFLTIKSVKSKIFCMGFKGNVMYYLRKADIYIDIFPSGGGSSIIEAMQAGLPVLTFMPDYSQRYEVNSETLDYTNCQELSPSFKDFKSWHIVLSKLIEDKGYRIRMGKKMAEKSVDYKPQIVSNKFYNIIEEAYLRKTL